MATNIYTKGLELYLEANSLSGADGASVSAWSDLSGKGRTLTCASNRPTVKTNAINGKKSVNFNGASEPLTWTGNLEIRCGFAIVKINSFADYDGILSGIDFAPILVGGGADSQNFYDIKYKYYEYRLNDLIYSPVEAWENGERVEVLNAKAPVGGFGIIYFKYWTNLGMDGVQLGQDRHFTARKLNGEIALLALYNRDFCESEVRRMFRTLSFFYRIPIMEVYPYSGMKGDARSLSKNVLTDGQTEPIVRVKNSTRREFSLQFADRTMSEVKDFRAFWDEFYPAKGFVYRDLNLVPPEDTRVRFTVPQKPQISENLNFSSYAFEVFESSAATETAIAAASEIPESVSSDDTTPPDTMTGLTLTPFDKSISIIWDEALDDTDYLVI